MSRNARLLLAVVALAIVGTVVWKMQRHPDPHSASAADVLPPKDSTPAPSPLHAATNSNEAARIAALNASLAAEKTARAKAEAEAAALKSQLAPLATNVVVSLGTVEDIGKRTGQFLPALMELEALSRKDASKLTAEEQRRLLQLQRDHAQLLGSLPQITGFQNNPDEYGRFFSSLFQQAAGLNDQQAAEVQDFMRQRAATMNQAGLNAAKEPADPKLEEQWEERRDKFNEETADNLKKVLPPGAAEKVNLSPELMEFLEMDFNKLAPKTGPARAQ
jgi:hypothetical protein